MRVAWAKLRSDRDVRAAMAQLREARRFWSVPVLIKSAFGLSRQALLTGVRSLTRTANFATGARGADSSSIRGAGNTIDVTKSIDHPHQLGDARGEQHHHGEGPVVPTQILRTKPPIVGQGYPDPLD